MSEVQYITGERLKSFIERLEKLKEEKRAVFAEAKGEGVKVKAMRQLIKLRNMKPNDREEMEDALYIYNTAIEMD